MWNSNFNFEELLSIFFVSTTFTSLKALLVNVFVCRSNHSGLVGMSVIFETMIPPSLTPLQSSLSPFFSTFNLCFSSLAGDSKLSAFETIPFSPILFCPCLSWSRSSFDFIIGSISCPLFCLISESVFSFNSLPDRPFLFFFFLSLRSFDRLLICEASTSISILTLTRTFRGSCSPTLSDAFASSSSPF